MIFNGVKTGGSRDIVTGVVASGQDVAFGAFVKRAADGYIMMTNSGSNVAGYIGVAADDAVGKDVDGFYSAGDVVPIITSGIANAWLLGGEVVCTGNYLKFPTLGAGTEGVGVLAPETAGTKTVYSVAKYVGRNDAGDADYDQDVSAISGKTLTCSELARLDLAEGDYVVIDSDEAAEVNMVDDPAASTTTFTVAKTPLASHETDIKVYKLVQIPVQLVI